MPPESAARHGSAEAASDTTQTSAKERSGRTCVTGSMWIMAAGDGSRAPWRRRAVDASACASVPCYGSTTTCPYIHGCGVQMIVVDAGLIEGDGLRFTFRQQASVPFAFLACGRRRGVREWSPTLVNVTAVPGFTRVRAGHRHTRRCCRAILICVRAIGDRPERAGDRRRRRRRPQRLNVAIQRECPYRVTCRRFPGSGCRR